MNESRQPPKGGTGTERHPVESIAWLSRTQIALEILKATIAQSGATQTWADTFLIVAAQSSLEAADVLLGKK